MPGSGLAIRSSDYLINADIEICITAVSQENEEKVRDKIKSIRPDIRIMSLFPASKHSIPIYKL